MTDAWAFGCVAYELLTLERAFEASCLRALCQKVAQGAYDEHKLELAPHPAYLKAIPTAAHLLQLDPLRRTTLAELQAMLAEGAATCDVPAVLCAGMCAGSAALPVPMLDMPVTPVAPDSGK